MKQNRKREPLRVGTVSRSVLTCVCIAAIGVAYVWQKNQIDRLGMQIREREKSLAKMKRDNENLGNQIAFLHSPVMIDRRAKELNLGLAPATPLQVVRLTETPVAPEKNGSRQFAQRPATELTP